MDFLSIRITENPSLRLPSTGGEAVLRKENCLKRARIQKGSVVRNKRFGTWNFLWFDENGKRRSAADFRAYPLRKS